MSDQPERRLEPIEERTYRFSLRVVKLVRALPTDASALVLGRQLLRAATSVGANVEEAIGAPSKRDFANKMNIALKEARETYYWLRLVRDAGILSEERLAPIVQESLEIKKILSATVRSSRENPDRQCLVEHCALSTCCIVHLSIVTCNLEDLWQDYTNTRAKSF